MSYFCSNTQNDTICELNGSAKTCFLGTLVTNSWNSIYKIQNSQSRDVTLETQLWKSNINKLLTIGSRCFWMVKLGCNKAVPDLMSSTQRWLYKLNNLSHKRCIFRAPALVNGQNCLTEACLPLEDGSAILVQHVDNGHKQSSVTWHQTDWSLGSGVYDSWTIFQCSISALPRWNKQGLKAGQREAPALSGEETGCSETNGAPHEGWIIHDFDRWGPCSADRNTEKNLQTATGQYGGLTKASGAWSPYELQRSRNG